MGQVNWIFLKDTLKSADMANQKSNAFMYKWPVNLLLVKENLVSYFQNLLLESGSR